MTGEHENLVRSQFGSTAESYLSSSVHAQGTEFAEMREQVAKREQAKVLDLGCGAGHVSYNVAPVAGSVVALDLSEEMLAIVKRTAQEQGLDNITVQPGMAERLPFGDASFDFVFSRYSAHHWRDIGSALSEVRRVLRVGGQAAFVDVVSPASPRLDTYLQTVEILRDNSHVRDYSMAEWLQLLGVARLGVTRCVRQRLRLDFDTWTERMNTPEPMRQAIRTLQGRIGQEVRHYYEIDRNGSFCVDVMVLWAQPL
ncbi:ubiquinone/menaquinone biosynthesis C-methylase UbiE [Pseudomonas duriflava]|uniref:Ubiquinone/menaquinone biosynthesis C-methylase UbiE n=1 Tax=Pseudomonas duriflava TaxID=459528 RepID=A0A562Q8M2_9PSED|nr:class I SAM-dependent methyltransferase [Pseudomonas duriflava]TWI53083.1 ubiquinone/menaquinone biosynthesis C-methylase UbiE [Pseudomonas duriflava]